MRLALMLFVAVTFAPGLVAASDISVSDAWARATAPTAVTGAAYLSLSNGGQASDRLISASSPAAEAVELHDMSMQDGVMRMREIDGIEIPAGDTVTLAPRGLHIMLINLTGPLSEGATVPLELTFAQAGAISVDVQVLSPRATGIGGLMNMDGNKGSDGPADHSHH